MTNRHNRLEPEQNDELSSFASDRDRILTCTPFRRLAGVTQVVSPIGETQLFYNRLSHSLTVGQVGRRIAQFLLATGQVADTDISPDVVEAAGLAHDLGHPPFGHIGEQTLHKLCRAENLDGFEGNAQTFRILTKLAMNPNGQMGLNLSRATLAAVLKYPWLYDPDGDLAALKWNAYVSERREFMFATEGQRERSQTLEAQIMDWADDVAYSLHDFADFYRAGVIDGGLFRREMDAHRIVATITRRSSSDPDEIARAWYGIAALAPFEGLYDGSPSARSKLQMWIRLLNVRFVHALSVENGHLRISPDVRAEVDILKAITFTQVIERPTMALTQEGHRRTISSLFDALHDWIAQAYRTSAILPPLLRELIDGTQRDHEQMPSDLVRVRAVADYISALTEREAIEVLERLTGRVIHSTGAGMLR